MHWLVRCGLETLSSFLLPITILIWSQKTIFGAGENAHCYCERRFLGFIIYSLWCVSVLFYVLWRPDVPLRGAHRLEQPAFLIKESNRFFVVWAEICIVTQFFCAHVQRTVIHLNGVFCTRSKDRSFFVLRNTIKMYVMFSVRPSTLVLISFFVSFCNYSIFHFNPASVLVLCNHNTMPPSWLDWLTGQLKIGHTLYFTVNGSIIFKMKLL